MNVGIAGFILGVILAVVGLLVVQRLLVAPVADEISYHFYTSVFDGPEFPKGDLANGRQLRRLLLQIGITTTFYNARYEQVTHAEQPGRYGAVVRIKLAGRVVYRFITLYRIPQPIAWDATPLPATATLPPALGLDPVVLRNQQHEIGEAIATGAIDDDGNGSPQLAVLLAGLSETSPGDPPAVERTNVVARDAAWWYGLRKQIGLTPRYPYLVDLPRDYDADPSKPWPLILFLHSAADRGTDLKAVRVSGLAGRIHAGLELPAIVVSPQCPAGEPWSMEVLSQLLDEVGAKYRVDPDRISVTGISAGGDGTWDFGLTHPERLAAIVPINGESDPTDTARLKNLPVWAFHGEKDQSVPVGQTIAMINGIRQAGGHPHLTLFPDAGHEATWDQAYATEALYPWLLAQKRGAPEVLTPGVPAPLKQSKDYYYFSGIFVSRAKSKHVPRGESFSLLLIF